jgi:hypothetical protein
MHLLAESTPLPASVPDARTTFALPAKYWLNTGGTPTWQGLEWSMSDDIRALFSCFQTMLMVNRDDRQYSVYAKPVDASLRTLRQKIIDMQKLPCVRDIFDFVLSQAWMHSYGRFDILNCQYNHPSTTQWTNFGHIS